MPFNRLPIRDPRTVARDIPGVLDVLFPRLSGGLVAALNRKMFEFEGIVAVPDELIEESTLQKAMLFELAVARAESLLRNDGTSSWDACLRIASGRQRRHFDAKIPANLDDIDIEIAERAAHNLTAMLHSAQSQHPKLKLELAPLIPGLGWIGTGHGDFALGSILIEVKHTARNFGASDFRQVLMYWLLKYASCIESSSEVWSEVLLLNPRRNAALLVNFDYLLYSSSAQGNRVELVELLRSAVAQEFDRR